MTVAAFLLGLTAAAGGVLTLRAAWSRRGDALRVLVGWALVGLGAVGWRFTGCAWDKAVALAILTPALIALAVIAATAELPDRARRARPRPAGEVAPPVSGGPFWRAGVRIACVGPLGLAAAVGCGAFTALRPPWEAADRLVACGFVTPLVWAAAMVWAMTDDRLGRVVAALALVTFVSLTAAAL